MDPSSGVLNAYGRSFRFHTHWKVTAQSSLQDCCFNCTFQNFSLALQKVFFPPMFCEFVRRTLVSPWQWLSPDFTIQQRLSVHRWRKKFKQTILNSSSSYRWPEIAFHLQMAIDGTLGNMGEKMHFVFIKSWIKKYGRWTNCFWLNSEFTHRGKINLALDRG